MATCDHYFRCVLCGLPHDDVDSASIEAELRARLGSAEAALRELHGLRGRLGSAEAALRAYDDPTLPPGMARAHFAKYGIPSPPKEHFAKFKPEGT
jgi:hypothetical protein